MILLFALACERTPDAQLLVRALDAATPLADAIDACRQMKADAEECVAGVVRDRPEADATPCLSLTEERWRAECHFTVAERRIQAADRWGALRECGLSGRYYDECLYHMWSREMQASATPVKAGEISRALDFLEAGRPIVLYWSGIRSLAQDPETLLWDDWWFFAHTRNKPAELAACDTLPDPADAARCERGTLLFVERTVTETLIRPSYDPQALDRACRALGDGDSDVPLEARFPPNILTGLYVADPRMDEAALRGLRNACMPDVARPWNPVFRPVLAQLPGEGGPPGGMAPGGPPLPEGVQGGPTRPPPGGAPGVPMPEGVQGGPTRPPPPDHPMPGSP